MKTLLIVLAKIVGVAFMLLAFWQWISFDYPDINPLRLGGILVPGVMSQVLNWLIVAVLATIGWGLFTLGRFKLGTSHAGGKQQ